MRCSRLQFLSQVLCWLVRSRLGYWLGTKMRDYEYSKGELICAMHSLFTALNSNSIQLHTISGELEATVKCCIKITISIAGCSARTTLWATTSSFRSPSKLQSTESILYSCHLWNSNARRTQHLIPKSSARCMSLALILWLIMYFVICSENVENRIFLEIEVNIQVLLKSNCLEASIWNKCCVTNLETH